MALDIDHEIAYTEGLLERVVVALGITTRMIELTRWRDGYSADSTWSLRAFMGPDGRGSTGKHTAVRKPYPGPAGQLFLGPHGVRRRRAVSSCQRTIPWLPRDLGLSSMAFGSGPLTVHVGVVAAYVTAVQFRFERWTRKICSGA